MAIIGLVAIYTNIGRNTLIIFYSKATPNENIVSRPGFLYFTCGRAPITISHYYEYHYEHNEYN